MVFEAVVGNLKLRNLSDKKNPVLFTCEKAYYASKNETAVTLSISWIGLVKGVRTQKVSCKIKKILISILKFSKFTRGDNILVLVHQEPYSLVFYVTFWGLLFGCVGVKYLFLWTI